LKRRKEKERKLTDINDQCIWCCITGNETIPVTVFGTVEDGLRYYFSTQQFSIVDEDKIVKAELTDGFFHVSAKQKSNLVMLLGEPTIEQLDDHDFFVANTIRSDRKSIMFTINFKEMRPTTTVEEALMEYMKLIADFAKKQ